MKLPTPRILEWIRSTPRLTAETRWWIGVGCGVAIALLITGFFWGFGDDPDLPQAGRIVIRENTFTISLDNRGILRGVGPLDARYRDTLRAALQTRRLRLPTTGIVFLEDRPTLRWSPLPTAESYEIAILEESSGKLITRDFSAAAEYRILKRLIRGTRYAWYVRPKIRGTGQAESKPSTPFQIAAAAFFDVVNGLPKSLTLRGVVFAEAGVLEAARVEFEELRRLNPQSAVVSSWIDQLDRAMASR